ncbi:unnamed protein product [Pseudo-nitzschia multistriata]|uniref:RanBD1 domain-containing protein n=1 Tax=Pseudo-nitzschia multistriata TaxID=183589 RepID=A0A448YV44_9STRA|nr:unnamed protein product [Pseudo-nitzschia multistriata]
MGKRGNDLSQVSKEDYEASMKASSDVPTGPFAKASDDVMKKRRIVRGRRSAVRKGAPSAAAGSGVFSGVALNASPGATLAPSSAGGSSNPFGGFTFGAGTSKTLPIPSAPAESKTSAFPSFAVPAAAPPKPATTFAAATAPGTSKTSEATEEDKKLIECAQAFLKHAKKHGAYDAVGAERFAATFRELSKSASSSTASTKPPTKTAAAASTSTSWDASRPLFGAKPPASSPAAPLFGAAAPAPATGGFSFNTGSKPAASPAAPGGFSFNPTKTGASAAPVPAFSFSTTPTPAVKAAAEAAAAESASKAGTGAGDGDGENKDDQTDNDGAQEAEDNPCKTLFKANTKILRVKTNNYIKGVLKLEEHKETKKTSMVVRDKAVGHVQLNVAITKGMPIKKTIAQGKKSQGPTPIVLITAVFDETSGDPELFKVITKMEDHEKLYDELSKLV